MYPLTQREEADVRTFARLRGLDPETTLQQYREIRQRLAGKGEEDAMIMLMQGGGRQSGAQRHAVKDTAGNTHYLTAAEIQAAEARGRMTGLALKGLEASVQELSAKSEQDRQAKMTFEQAIEELQQRESLEYVEAMNRVAQERPDLYHRWRERIRK